jgi:hypothetical protein
MSTYFTDLNLDGYGLLKDLKKQKSILKKITFDLINIHSFP